MPIQPSDQQFVVLIRIWTHRFSLTYTPQITIICFFFFFTFFFLSFFLSLSIGSFSTIMCVTFGCFHLLFLMGIRSSSLRFSSYFLNAFANQPFKFYIYIYISDEQLKWFVGVCWLLWMEYAAKAKGFERNGELGQWFGVAICSCEKVKVPSQLSSPKLFCWFII